MIRLISSAGLAVLLVSCGDTTQSPITQLNLDRPVDVAFACYGGLRLTSGGTTTISAQPLASCTIRTAERGKDDPEPRPPGQEDVGGDPGPVNFYGFILQSLRGTVALAQFPTVQASLFGSVAGTGVTIKDADPLTPGNNSISVGEEPIAIATDKAGCFEVTANAGSCDVSTIDVKSAVDDDPSTPVKVERMQVKNAAGQPILARPAAMAVEPQTDVIGNACPATATGLFYIAYPSCHLVAGVDMATGTIVTGIQYSAAGVPSIVNGNVTCPAECGEANAPPITPGVRPVTLHLEYDPRVQTRRLAIGADNSASFTLVELDTNARPQSLSQIALENTTGTLGLTSITMSPQIGMGGATGIMDDVSPGGQAQYVYATATDGTVRVADVLSLRTECDTQVDPRYARSVKNVRAVSCFANGAATTPPRRPGAKGPGIELVGDTKPTSVEIFRVDPFETSMKDVPQGLDGYFAMVTSTSGAIFIVNVDDDAYPDLFDPASAQRTAPPLVMAHQLRDQIVKRDLKPTKSVPDPSDSTKTIDVPSCDTDGPDPDAQAANAGGPRSTSAPTRTVPPNTIGASKLAELPYIRQVKCTDADQNSKPVSELQFAAEWAPPVDGAGVRDREYPDLRALRSDEIWTLSWEGTLSLDKQNIAIDGPQIRDGQMLVDGNGVRLVDQTKPFCNMGVEPFDIVQLRGCDPSLNSSDCPTGYTCYVHPQSQVAGLGQCMLADEAERLANACQDFLTSFQRYTVGRAETGQLVLLPRKHVLRTTPIDGCTSDAQCESLADYALQNLSDVNPADDHTAPDPHTYACVTDPDRAPVNADPTKNKRCVETCTDTSQCIVGTVCQNGFCMEGVTPPQACVNGPQRFEVHASEAFALIGTKSGYVHSTIAQGDSCVRDPAASPWVTGRVPLNPPACDPTADPFTGKNAAGVLEPNPCSTTVTQVENAPNYVPGTCQLQAAQTVLAERQAPAIRFRNRGMTLTIVDPYYPGDKTCVLDRGGTLDKVPLVFDGYQITFRQTAGFFPLLLPVAPTFPIKVVRGPSESIWVLDAGDFLSNSLTSASTRGEVFRIEPASLGVSEIR